MPLIVNIETEIALPVFGTNCTAYGLNNPILVHSHVSSLPKQPPSHNCAKNNQIKNFLRCRVTSLLAHYCKSTNILLYSRDRDWTRLGRSAMIMSLTRLHSTRLDRWWVSSLSVVQKQIRDTLRQTQSPWPSAEILRPATSLPYDVCFLRRVKGLSNNHLANLHLVLRTCGSHFAHTCVIKKLHSECSESIRISFAIFTRQTPIWSHDWPHFHCSSTLLACQHFSCPSNLNLFKSVAPIAHRGVLRASSSLTTSRLTTVPRSLFPYSANACFILIAVLAQRQ
jgi:hypothetical protein